DETKAHKHYLDLAHKILIPEIQLILTQMAADEERHCQCFAEAKRQFCSKRLIYDSPLDLASQPDYQIPEN
ncbi:MAG: ferritin family protein, partial [Desulfitobacteriaceae bacterium]